MDPHAVIVRLQAVAAAVAAVRLIHLGLAKRFPALLGYLILVAFYSCAYGILSPRSPAYFWIYVAVGPVECIFSIFAVRELVALIFARYPGIRTVGRWSIYIGVASATVISLWVAKFLSTGYHHRKWGLYYLESAQRCIVFTLVIAIAAILFVLSRYPLHLGRNTYVSGAFFSLLFLSDAARLLLDSLAPHFYNHFVDWGEAFFVSACLGSWALMLAPETAPVARVAFSNAQEEHLLQQLESLNQLMSRASRR